jgi:hypothetical protein
MLYENQNSIEESDNNALPTEDSDKFTAKAEMPQENTAEGTDERIVVGKTADKPDDMDNEIYLAPVTSYPIFEDFPAEVAIDYTEDYYNTDEVVLDPDNFEYFKGVSSNSSETNFVNR